MTGRAFLVSMATVAIVSGLAGRCTAPAPKGLPKPVQAIVTRHTVASAVDTAIVNRLERDKAAARRRELAAAASRRAAEDSAAAAGRRADSLEARAKAAETAADSAAVWQQAYYSRSGEAEDLRLALGDAKAETRAVKEQLTAADSSAGVWKGRALRADTVVAQLLPLAEAAGDRCRILWAFDCPSRKAAAVASVVATAGAIYVGKKVAKGEIKIRLPIG